jgi:hypothetical protein
VIARCTQRQPIAFHPTRDADMSAAAANTLQVAMFRSGSKAICKCQNGECAPADCDALYVLDAAGNRGATFHGKQYRAMEKDGGLCVYKLSAQQALDSRPKITVADVDRMNREAYARPDIHD